MAAPLMMMAAAAAAPPPLGFDVASDFVGPATGTAVSAARIKLDDDSAANRSNHARPTGYPWMDLVKLPQTQANGAACLDGSAPAYWFVEGAASTKYYINFEGGGWCTSLDDCYNRAYGSGRRKGSSGGLPDPFNLIGLMGSWGNWYFSNQTDDGQGHALNPVMHDWNMLQVLYCDGEAEQRCSCPRHTTNNTHTQSTHSLSFSSLTAVAVACWLQARAGLAATPRPRCTRESRCTSGARTT